MSASAPTPKAVQYAVKSVADAVSHAAKKSISRNAVKTTPIASNDVRSKSYIPQQPRNGTPQDTPYDKTGAAKSKGSTLLHFFYDTTPKAVNYTTFVGTKAILEDPSHPFHIKVSRRMAAFDPNKLHWRVHVPYEVSKKSAIRNWGKKRIMRAVKKKLEERGLETNGVLKGTEQDVGMKGALLIVVSKDPKVALASEDEEIESAVGHLLGKVMQIQEGGQRSWKGRPGQGERHRRNFRP